MSKKIKITVTIDGELFETFKKALPEYITVSGLIETWIKEYMAGYYRYQWSVGEMIEVIRGRMSVDYLQRINDLGLRGLPQGEIDEKLHDENTIEQIGTEGNKPQKAKKTTKPKKG